MAYHQLSHKPIDIRKESACAFVKSCCNNAEYLDFVEEFFNEIVLIIGESFAAFYGLPLVE